MHRRPAAGTVGTLSDCCSERAGGAALQSGERSWQPASHCRAWGEVGSNRSPGPDGGFVDKIPFGALVNKALTVRSGQTHVQRYMRPLLELIEKGSIDPGFVVTHRLALVDAPRAYRMFRDKQDSCIKVVLKPWADVPTVEAAEPEAPGLILH